MRFYSDYYLNRSRVRFGKRVIITVRRVYSKSRFIIKVRLSMFFHIIIYCEGF